MAQRLVTRARIGGSGPHGFGGLPGRYARLVLAVPALIAANPLAAQTQVIQQDNGRNYLRVIQERNPFHTTSRTLTATTGRTTVTEIVEIGPDPQPLSVTQVGAANRAWVYQQGTAPNIDIRQSGMLNVVRNVQRSMP